MNRAVCTRRHCVPLRCQCHNTRKREYSDEDRLIQGWSHYKDLRACWKLTVTVKRVKKCLWLRKGMVMKEIDHSLGLIFSTKKVKKKKKKKTEIKKNNNKKGNKIQTIKVLWGFSSTLTICPFSFSFTFVFLLRAILLTGNITYRIFIILVYVNKGDRIFETRLFNNTPHKTYGTLRISIND